MAKKKVKKIISPAEKKSVLTAFVLLLPSMLITVLTTREPSTFICGFAIALFCLQAILIKTFVEDHYLIR